jgi:hypothetical protein
MAAVPRHEIRQAGKKQSKAKKNMRRGFCQFTMWDVCLWRAQLVLPGSFNLSVGETAAVQDNVSLNRSNQVERLAFIGTSNGLLYVGRFVENTQGSEVTTNLTRRWESSRLNLTTH